MMQKVLACLMSAAVIAGAALTATAAPIVFSAGGSNSPASIQATVDSFRAVLGAPNNGNNPGPLAGGRREINWDGGGSTSNTPVGTPFGGFRNTRGGQFITPGTGFVQAPPTGGPNGGLEAFFSNPTYDTTFGAFSLERLFVPVGSNITDALFFVPGTNGAAPATIAGFGAVFADVDLPMTHIDFFDIDDNLLFQGFVPVGTVADASLSFLGVFFNAGEEIARVRITTGNAPLGPNDFGGIDVVAMDDFLFSEPKAVPEPGSLALFGLGGGLLFLRAMARARRAAVRS